MVYEKIDLYEYFGITRPANANGYLTVMTHFSRADGILKLRPAMLVITGGGYAFLSDRENEPVALTYLAKGYNSFVLDYSIAPVSFPAQLLEGCMAVIYIRENAEKFDVIPDQICAVGFSAGGHLCAMLATVRDNDMVNTVLGEKAGLSRPDAVILSYPVIDGAEYAHRGSFNNLCAGDNGLEEHLSIQKRVNHNSVPAFIWTTVTDPAVPSENSLLMAWAYKKAGVPFEIHVFDKGPHGFSLATMETCVVSGGGDYNNPHVAKWLDLSIEWLENRGFGIRIVDQ